MASSSFRIGVRVLLLLLLLLLFFYVGRPLYWKLSATFHEIRQKSVKDGFSHIVTEAQKSIGWYHDESDVGGVAKSGGDNAAATSRRRRLLYAPSF
ncbi:hypothetical protein EJ110_NYTH28996 [Nymphaea thermarum]|nr:hypothetical protein EJ110_NYTH28996 [Nymphaea thermarum]